MNTPRLALLALLALCAFVAPPGSRAAELTWDRIQNGDAWQGINFTDENGVARTYYYRTDEEGQTPTLYLLNPKADPLVKNSTALEATPSAYKVKLTVTGLVFKDTNCVPSCVVTRAGTSLSLTAKAGSTYGKALWQTSSSAKYVDQPVRGGGKKRVRVDQYELEKYSVVVGPPLGTGENLDPTPMGNYKENVPATAWSSFYFDAPPPGRGVSYSYNLAKTRYAELRRRVYPFEVIYDPKSCFVSQEGCSDAEAADIAAAAEEAAAGNLRTVESLTKAGHARIRNRATVLRNSLDSAPEDSFGPEETELLQRLLVNYNQQKAFDAELASARSKPEDLKKFVAKWRGYLKGEIDAYLKDPNLNKSEMPDRVALRKAQADRMQAVVAEKVAAPAAPVPPKKEDGTAPGAGNQQPPFKPPFNFADGNLNGAFGGLDSSIGKPTPGKEWYVFAVTGGAAASGHDKAYCRLGNIPKDYMSWVKAAGMANRPFECVILKQPVPKAAAGKLEAELAGVGTATFNTPIPAAVGEIKMRLGIVPWAAMTLSKGAPLQGVTTFLPKWGAGEGPKTDAPDAAVSQPATVLSTRELAWLTKVDASEYNDRLAAANKLEGDKKGPAIAALVKEYRGKIAANLAPDTAYADAAAKTDVKADELDKLLPKTPYGGDAKAVVGPTGPDATVQLTEEEFKKLSPAAQKTYLNARIGKDGYNGNITPLTDAEYKALSPEAKAVYDRDLPKREFNKNAYDPIALHAATVAARGPAAKPDAKPDGKPAKPETKPGDAAVTPLDDKEIALLTPAERKKYEGQRTAANATPPSERAKKELDLLTKQYRDRIAAEKRSAYPPELEGKTDITEKQFDDMQEWAKRRYCANRPIAAGTYANDQRAAGLKGGNAKVVTDLQETQASQGDNGPKTSTNQTASSPSWADAKCKDHRDNPPDISNSRQNVSGSVPKPGDDTETKEEVKKPWVTAPLLIRGAQGALVGLLIGSLFGPVGLIAGPLIGAALFYGVSKYMTDKEADSKDK